MSVTSDGEIFRHDSSLSLNDNLDFDTTLRPRDKRGRPKPFYKSPREMTIYELNSYIKNLDKDFNNFNEIMKSYGWRRLKMKFLSLFCCKKQKTRQKCEEEVYKSWKSFVPYYRQQREIAEMYRNKKEWEKVHLQNTPFCNSIKI